MTRYLNPSEILSDLVLTTEDEQEAVNGREKEIFNSVDDSEIRDESLDWESQMAKLVGLEEELIPEEKGLQDNSISSSSSLQQEVNTKPSFSTNPFTKLGLVGASTLIIFVLAGGFLLQIMEIGQKKPSPKNITTAQSQPQQKTETRLEKLESEVEILKTKLAFAEQEEAIKTAQKTLRSKKNTPTAPVSSAAPSRNPVAPQIQTVYVPKIVTVERVVRVPESVSSPKNEPPVAQSVNSSVAQSTPVPSPVNPPVNPNVPVQPVPVAIVQPTPQPVNNYNQAVPQNPAPANDSNYNQAVSQNPVPVGTSASGVLATAVFGETSKSRNNDEEKDIFVVTLQEPLKNREGEVILDTNTQLLTEINSLSDKGLLYLSVTKVIQEKQGNVIEKSLPKGTLTIRSPQGKPLFAKQYPNQSGSIASMDMGVFVLGGLGKVAQLFNRTESEVVTTNVAGTVITNNNKTPNFAAGGLEGGINAIVPQITQRNQQRISEKLQRTNIWFIPAGTEVEVYVNQPLHTNLF